MLFERRAPAKEAERFVDCFWIAQNEDPTSVRQKIIPDGFTEVIFHFGDPFRINLQGRWEQQDATLLAGQLTRHFYLENTAAADVMGIKLRPAALTQLFGIGMDTLTNKVVALHEAGNNHLDDLAVSVRELATTEHRIDFINRWFAKHSEKLPAGEEPVEKTLDEIFRSKGTATVEALAKAIFVSERQVERLFKRYVGVSPKAYSRIIRFNALFSLLKAKDASWTKLAYETGYYDQSHFIRNFKSFTGEEPSHYLFEQPNLANFFLLKS